MVDLVSDYDYIKINNYFSLIEEQVVFVWWKNFTCSILSLQSFEWSANGPVYLLLCTIILLNMDFR